MNKKRKLFWRVFRVSLSIFLLLIIAVVVIPIIFKGQILDRVKKELNKQVEASIDFCDFNVTLISHFPNLTVSLDELAVIGTKEFAGDTLASMKQISAVVDLISVFKGEAYSVKSITIDKPVIGLKINKNEKTNWDILPETQATEKEISTPRTKKSPSFNILLKRFAIHDARIDFRDVPGNMYLMINGFDHILSGDLSADRSVLKTQTNIESLTFSQDGIRYLYKAVLDMKADIDADIKNSIYKFEKNSIQLNALILEIDGSVAMAGEDLNILLTYNAPKNSFGNVLSLVPAIFLKDFEGIETKGNFSLNGYVKGIYNENTIPSFGMDLKVDDGMFKYPDLPNSVDNIVVRAKIDNSGGDVDNTVIDINRFGFSMMDNPFMINLLLKQPVSDPYIKGKIGGMLDLSSVQKVYPLDENETLSGVLDINVTMEGNMSTIENEDYRNFKAMGSVVLKGMEYQMEGFSKPFAISDAQINFSPEYIDLVNFDFKYASSNLSVKGKVENYLAYALDNGVLKGSLNAHSSHFNVNDFMEEPDAAGKVEPTDSDTVDLSVFEVPANIDFAFKSSFNKLIYDKVVMEDVNGQIIVKDEKVWMKGLNGRLFNGEITVNGSYDTRDRTRPVVDFDLNINRLSIPRAAETFAIMEKYAPIARHMTGDFSTKMGFSTLLNEDMMPDWATLAGSGVLNTSAVSVENVNTLNKLSDALKTDKFRKLDMNAIKLSFEIEDGKVNVKPFELKMKDMKATVSGWTALDETIDYDMDMQIPRSIFGSQANDVLQGLVSKANEQGASLSLGETVNLEVMIGGTLSDPSVKTGLAGGKGSIAEDVKKKIQEEVDKKKEELEQKAKEEAQRILADADALARKILEEAQKQADQIKKSAREAAQKTRDEADKQAKKLLEEAKKKGPLAEIAAKKTTDELKKEADKKAGQMVAEADKQADGILQKARQEANNIRAEAQKKINN